MNVIKMQREIALLKAKAIHDEKDIATLKSEMINIKQKMEVEK